MYQISRRLEPLVRPVVEARGCELWGIEYLPARGHGLLRIFIDREGGVTLEDCEAVSHQLSGVFDVEDPIGASYTLEVSSPGLDRPLLSDIHFQRYVGHKVSLRTREKVDGRRNFKGVLSGFEQGVVTLEVEDRRLSLNLDEIERARLLPDYAAELRGT